MPGNSLMWGNLRHSAAWMFMFRVTTYPENLSEMSANLTANSQNVSEKMDMSAVKSVRERQWLTLEYSYFWSPSHSFWLLPELAEPGRWRAGPAFNGTVSFSEFMPCRWNHHDPSASFQAATSVAVLQQLRWCDLCWFEFHRASCLYRSP